MRLSKNQQQMYHIHNFKNKREESPTGVDTHSLTNPSGKDGKEKDFKEKYWDVYRPPGLIKINEEFRYFPKEGTAA